jgi:hypothetical protein
MNEEEKYSIEHVQGPKPDTLKNEIIDFWLDHGALTSCEEAEERAEQVFCLGRDRESGKIEGVGSVFEKFNQRLENSFYYYRSFVAPAYRRSLMATGLILHTRDHLEDAFTKGQQRENIGMIVEVENEFLKQHRNQAVWPYSKFVYIGKNGRGDHVRVYYFDGALI